ncbi:hypothetical protein BDY19DRAFT_563372 [Irpex rosettiformis]|uniref:Uncharacterized protein n=1 Tax=Irpex rosettiformis TaxID=378272 RepID=A0ACB8UC80_9APHY|nr:hypothetical protein BDY19DRAFT_563372 [Irpex rosettiformis]
MEVTIRTETAAFSLFIVNDLKASFLAYGVGSSGVACPFPLLYFHSMDHTFGGAQMALQEEIDSSITRHVKDLRSDISRIVAARRPIQEAAQRSTTSDMPGRIVNPHEKRIVCLVDGDGNIFSPQYLSRGMQGGNEAAETITQVIQEYFPPDVSRPYRLHVWVFLNKRGLRTTLEGCGTTRNTSAFNLGDFMRGFNQSSRHFMMVDVGAAKEAADHKICALLEEETLSVRTTSVILGGCHDNGYAGILKELKTRGYGQKLWLLEGYDSTASHIRNLGLPSIKNKGLFISKKLEVSGEVLNRSRDDGAARNMRGRQRSRSEPPSATKDAALPPGSFPPPHPQAVLAGTSVGAFSHEPETDARHSAACLSDDTTTTAITDTFSSEPLKDSQASNYAASTSNETPESPTSRNDLSSDTSRRLCPINRNRPMHKQNPCVCAVDCILGRGSCKDTNSPLSIWFGLQVRPTVYLWPC